MITDTLTNVVYFSDLLPAKCPILNAHITDALRKRGIPFVYLTGTKDIWCRDYMPVQIEKNRLISYNYTPDYLQDKRHLRLQTNPVEVLQNEANDLLQLLPASTKKEMAFGIVHYAGNGKVLLTNYDDFSSYSYCRFRKILETRLEVIPLRYKTKRKHARSWAYINYLQVGSLALVPQLGLVEDEQALEQISNALPECKVVGIPALEAVRRGGALNCISWNVQS